MAKIAFFERNGYDRVVVYNEDRHNPLQIKTDDEDISFTREEAVELRDLLIDVLKENA